MENKCTCPKIKGPRMYDNPDFVMCDSCKEWHARFFPAFPGDPTWHLNSGAINRNGWGINPAKIKIRDHERVTELQLEAADRAVARAECERMCLHVIQQLDKATDEAKNS